MPRFGQDADQPERDARHISIETLLWGVAARVLALGGNVILDFGRPDHWLRSATSGRTP